MRLTIHFDAHDMRLLREKLNDPTLSDSEVVEVATQNAFKQYFEQRA